MDNLYLTLDKRVSEDLMEFDIQFADEKHPIFQAHFPNNSLLPGFLHIDVAAELLDKTLLEIPKAKFIQPILPQDTIQFIIKKKESKYLVTTKKENKKCSEFTFVTE